MGDGYNFQQLKREILALSQSLDWEMAKKEWRLISISEAEEPETCLCGHFPIRELCSISNKITGNTIDVGNVCVKRFIGLRSDLIFSAIKRIRKDLTKSLGPDATVLFFEKGVISQWEYQFQQNTMLKRNLSPKQLDARMNINKKVLSAVSRQGL